MKGSTDMTENHQPLAPYLMRPPRRWDATLPPENEGGFVGMGKP